MSENYKPGTVAEIGWTMTGGRERALWDGTHWNTETGIAVYPDRLEYVRPLVVLDLEDAPFADAHERGALSVAHLMRRNPTGSTANWVAEQIEAQTRPPKPVEPTGLGAVVEDEDGFIWVRLCADVWACSNVDNKTATTWETIPVARVLSEGVSA